MASSGDIPVIGPILNKMFGTRNERVVKRYVQRVEQIGALEAETRKLSDEELRGKVAIFRDRLAQGEKADDLQVEVFAVAREVMDRQVGIRNVLNPESGFDPQSLPESARGVYERVKAEADGLATILPASAAMDPQAQSAGGQPDVDDRFLGSSEAIEGWRQVDLPIELCEAVRELYPESRPPFRARPFDVQLIGGMVLGQGKIAEMKTGEGKTIVAPLACCMAAVERQQAHVVTVNDYLVQRDRDWTFPFFAGLGLTVGAIHPMHTQPEEVKRLMYRCDVVYGTTAEFGFDYLRDNMKRSVDQQVQRKRTFAVVDEVDSILIDEARTPLIISGMAHDDMPNYELADKLAKHLVEKQRPWQELEDRVQACKERIKGLEGDIRQARDKGEIPAMQKQLDEASAALPDLERERDQHPQFYEMKMERKQCHLSHEGIAEAQRVAQVGSFYIEENIELPHLLEQSLRAHAVYQLDRDYIVMPVQDRQTGRDEPSVVIVDSNTGRPMIGRQWSDGLHQAVEVKEGVPIKPETQTVASVTIQNFFKMYKRLAGMTGTADTEAQEFHDIYKLEVVSIPTNKPISRADRDDLMFLREKDKWSAIVDEIERLNDLGRPILVGTTSVEKSELLSQMLKRNGQVAHEVLNAKQHEREAGIVKSAGQLGAVMIATNMAGRGTDIKLGSFTREDLVLHWQRRGLASKKCNPGMSEDELREDIFRKVAPQVLKEEGLKKREVEEMDFADLELRLLRKWAEEHTWAPAGKIGSMARDELMDELDAGGRLMIHRVRWFENVEDIGGLHVIGTERHESRRIDNQLRGRSGRQGDNGSSRFFVSLEDDLMKMFAGETTMKLLSRMGMKEGDAIEHPWLSKNVERAQKKVEQRNFQIRKNILEYDEVMEHQRQRFYGLRQRVLEGLDVRGLIFEYIEEAVDDAIEDYLDPEYAARCAAEFARERLDCSIPAERLKGKQPSEMENVIRRLAKDDAASTIDVTLGEYMPVEGSEVSIDFDSAGLHRWAKSRFNLELDTGELREGGAAERAQVQQLLEDAAEKKIEEADLTGIAVFGDEKYGVEELCSWVKTKFTIELEADEVLRVKQDPERDVRDLILERANELYRQREIDYPADYAMQMTMAIARQSPEQAFESLSRWTRTRFGIDLPGEEIRSTPPQKVREKLATMQREFVESQRLEKSIEEACAIEDDDKLDAFLNERFGVGVSDRMRFLDDEERPDAIRARVENILRAEMLQVERAIFLDTLDSCWKDHLYAMDQLRDAIGFRAFSQQDPRIEYKREGQRIFLSMMETVRDRVTDMILKARMQPRAVPPAGGPAGGPTGGPVGGGPGGPGQARPAAGAGRSAGGGAPGRAMSGASIMGSSIIGPGFASSPAPQGGAGSGAGSGGGAPAGTPAPGESAGAPGKGEAGAGGDGGEPTAQDASDAARAALDADRNKKRTR